MPGCSHLVQDNAFWMPTLSDAGQLQQFFVNHFVEIFEFSWSIVSYFLTMIYMPSLMRPVRESASESAFYTWPNTSDTVKRWTQDHLRFPKRQNIGMSCDDTEHFCSSINEHVQSLRFSAPYVSSSVSFKPLVVRKISGYIHRRYSWPVVRRSGTQETQEPCSIPRFGDHIMKSSPDFKNHSRLSRWAAADSSTELLLKPCNSVYGLLDTNFGIDKHASHVSETRFISPEMPSLHGKNKLPAEQYTLLPQESNQLKVQFMDPLHCNSRSSDIPLFKNHTMTNPLLTFSDQSFRRSGENLSVSLGRTSHGLKTLSPALKTRNLVRKVNVWAILTKQSQTDMMGRLRSKSIHYPSIRITHGEQSSQKYSTSPEAVCAKNDGNIQSGFANTASISSVLSVASESNSSFAGSSSADYHRVVLNVSGLKFETWLGVLNNRPETLLGNVTKRMPFWDVHRKEYFFDRHRPSFEAIFNYYQYGGRLKRPVAVSDDIFLKELEFFQIEAEVIERYKRDEGYVPETVILPTKAWKRRLWLLFEYPETSLLAFCFSVTSVIFTVISIILFCVETLPQFATTHCQPGEKPNFLDPFFIIETMCTMWFMFELIIRFSSCPSHKSFLLDIKNLIDLVAIVPYYITLINVLISFSCEGAKNSASLAFLRVIRLIRVFKLTKHSSGLQVLVLTFKESVEGLGLFLVAFVVCILVFSSVIYYVEIDRKGSQIESIPDAFWWAVITMCTVGYGDKVPKGPLGKIVGSVCAVAGVLTLAIPVPIITENFNKFYAHKTGRGRR